MPSAFNKFIFEENSQSVSIPSLGHSLGSSRSSCETYMLVNFNNYVAKGKHKYGVEKTINYSFLNNVNRCFVSNLNKRDEPKSYEETSSDANWIKAMNL